MLAGKLYLCAKWVLVLLLLVSGSGLQAGPLDAGGTGGSVGATDIVTVRGLARFHLRSGQISGALQMLEQARRLDPDDLKAAKLRAIVEGIVSRGKVAEEIGKVTTLGGVQAVPPIANAWLHLQNKEFDKAIVVATGQIKDNPFDEFMAINYYTLGVAHYNNGKINEGIRWLRKSWKVDEDSPYFLQGYIQLARYYEKHKLPEQSKQTLLAAEKEYPNSDDLAITLGQFYLRNNNGKTALEKFEAVLNRQEPNPSVQIRFLTAQARFAQYNFTKAVKEFQALREQALTDPNAGPQAALALIWIARCQAALGQVDTAAKSFEDYLQIQPTNIAAAFRLGILQIHQDKIDEAIDRLEAVVTAQPKDTMGRWALAIAYQKKGNLEAAFKHLEEAQKTKKAGPKRTHAAGLFLALHYVVAGQMDKAQAALKGSAADPGNTDEPVEIGEGQVDLTKIFPANRRRSASDQALAYLCYLIEWHALSISASDKALSANPKNLLALQMRGNARFRNARTIKNDEEAVKNALEDTRADYMAAKKLDPMFSPAYISLALIDYALGEQKRAGEILHAYLDLKPKDSTAIARIAELSKNRGDFDLAVKALKQAVEVDPKNAKIEKLFANVYKSRRMLPETAQHYKKALELDPTLDDVRLQLLAILYAQKLDSQILEHAKKFVDISKHPQVYQTLALTHARMKHYDESVAALDQLLKVEAFADSVPHLTLKALALIADGKEAEARALLTPVADREPGAVDKPLGMGDARAVLLVAVLYHRKGDSKTALGYLDKADPVFNEMIEKVKDSRYAQQGLKIRALSRLTRANIAASLGLEKEAVRRYTEAAVYAPGFDVSAVDMKAFLAGLKKPEAFNNVNLALQYEINKWPEAATAEAQKAIDADETNFIARFVHARTLESEPQASLASLKKVIELQPRFPAGHLALFSAYAKLNNVEKAVAALQSAIELNTSESDNYRFRLASYLKLKGRYLEAAAELEKLIEAWPTNFNPYLALADSYGELKRYADRMKTYERLIENNEKNPVGYNQVAWILIEEGRELDRAIDLAQKGVNLCKQNPKISDQIRGTIIDTLGWGYIRKAEVETNPQEKQALLEKAQKKLEEAGFLVRTNPSIGYHLCVIYERTEQYAKALSLGKKLIAHAQRVGKFKEIELVNQLVERVTPKVNQ